MCKCFSYRWSLEDTVSLLLSQNQPEMSTVTAVRPSRYVHDTLSCFDNFGDYDSTGCPTLDRSRPRALPRIRQMVQDLGITGRLYF